MKVSPKCRICGQEMALVDENNRRWYCRKDGVVFAAKEEGWVQSKQLPSPPFSPVQSFRPKSYAIGLSLNFLLAGVMYAGSWAGLVYAILTVVVVVVYWPFAILVVVASYAHTILAIDQRNSRIHKQDLESASRILSENPVMALCPNCGLQLRLGTRYCRRCGVEVRGQALDESDGTRAY